MHAGMFEIKCSRCGTLNSFFEKMREQVIITDPKGVILYANDLVETTTGYSAKDIIGAKPSLWGKQMPNKFYQKLWDVIKNKKLPIKVKVKNKHKNGTIYHAEIHINPILDTNGKVRFYIGIEKIINKSKKNDQSSPPSRRQKT